MSVPGAAAPLPHLDAYSRAREEQLRTLENNAALVFSDLNARQQFMETHVRTIIPQISEFPVLAPEMEAVEIAQKALEEVKTAQETLQAKITQQTLEVHHKRQVLDHVTAELRSVEEISRKMPRKTEYYENHIATLGSMIVSQIGLQ